ncbi:MAG: hypothetical protein ACI9QQ_000770 [Myxococcota bacterium]|jgi:hypothetical protein
MTAFDYSNVPDPVREDIVAANRAAWEHIAAPGTWLTGKKRVAIAEETRRARSCMLCRARQEALSPFGIEGEHDNISVNSLDLPGDLTDAIHRISTDARRLTKSWYTKLIASGVSPEEYVEALGVAVITISIDEFNHAIGVGHELLPDPQDGKPSLYRPSGAEVEEGQAWVPVLGAGRIAPREMDLFAGIPPGAPPPNVIRALSLVPAEVRAWKRVAEVQYLSTADMTSFGRIRSIDRSQIELVAGRVSAINECFY